MTYAGEDVTIPLETFEQGKSAGTTAEGLDLGAPDEVWGVATDIATEHDDVMAAIRDEYSTNEDAA